MSSQQVQVARRIEAPPAAVWEVITDLTGAKDRLSQVSEVQVITDGPYALGTRWRETRTVLGSTETQEMVVIDNDPQRRTVLEARDDNLVYSTTLTLEPLDGGSATHLGMRFAVKIQDPTLRQRLSMKVLGVLGAKMTERMLRTELDDIAAAAEALPST